MRRPKVTTRCPADQYHGAQERIVEFSHINKKSKLRGGLISFMELESGELRVDVYRTDPGVSVGCARIADLERELSQRPAAHEYTEAEEAQLGQAFASLLRMRREAGKDGWRTGWGWKTNLGLFRLLRNIMHDADAGDTHSLCKLEKRKA